MFYHVVVYEHVCMQDDGKIEVVNGSAGELRLIVHDLVASDTAQYKCSASSDEDLGTHEMTASLMVHCKLCICCHSL